jgi:hypothetical protein
LNWYDWLAEQSGGIKHSQHAVGINKPQPYNKHKKNNFNTRVCNVYTENAMKAYTGSRYTAPHIPDPGTRD